MKYRQFSTNFWKDGYVTELTQAEKITFNYLLTNDRVNLCGIYELPDKYMKVDLDLTTESLHHVKNKLQNDRKVAFHKGWVYLVNFAEHNKFSPVQNVLTAFMKEFNSIPLEVREYFFVTLNLPYEVPLLSHKDILVTVTDKVTVTVNRVGGSLGGSLEEGLEVSPEEVEKFSREKHGNN